MARHSSTIERLQDSIVVVEDPLISNLVRAVLRKHGYSVVLADAAEVMRRFLRAPELFAGILVTNSPGSFLEFAGAIRLLYLSSSPDPRLEALFLSCRVVRKPFAPEELVRAIEQLEEL
jgi:DNA-binding response OmpR family regulator